MNKNKQVSHSKHKIISIIFKHPSPNPWGKGTELPGVVCFDVRWDWFIKLNHKGKVGLSTFKTKNNIVSFSLQV